MFFLLSFPPGASSSSRQQSANFEVQNVGPMAVTLETAHFPVKPSGSQYPITLWCGRPHCRLATKRGSCCQSGSGAESACPESSGVPPCLPAAWSSRELSRRR